MLDKIVISNLKVYCNHGVYEEEQKLGQNFYVSCELGVDTYKAGSKDLLDASVNYAELSHHINDWMINNRFDLIEAVAHNLSIYILNYSTLIRAVKLKISKPEAPIGLPFENVYVEINRAWHTVYIAYGSNIGDSKSIISEAIAKLKKLPAVRFSRQSATITTKPYGGVEQPDFLNGCICIETYLPLNELHIIENEAGRTRDIHWGPRTLDLDILLYDEEIIHTKDLTVPHIDMQNRSFVLEPLNEIAPYAYHPVLRKTINELLLGLK